MAAPLRVEVLAYAPMVFRQCLHCELVLDDAGVGRRVRAEQRAASLPADVRAEYERVSAWVAALAAARGPEVSVDVVDAASPRGFWKSLRHRVRRYPAVIVGGRVAPDLAAADEAIARALPVTGR